MAHYRLHLKGKRVKRRIGQGSRSNSFVGGMFEREEKLFKRVPEMRSCWRFVIPGCMLHTNSSSYNR